MLNFISFKNPLDDSIAEFFKQQLDNEALIEWMTIISCFFVFYFVISAFFIINKRFRVVGIIMLITLVLTYLSNDLIFKNIFTRERPFIEMGMATSPGFSIDGYSFPSGHSAISSAGTFSFFFYYLFFVKDKKGNKDMLIYSMIFLVFMLLIMLSRIVLLHHYFTDTIAGMVEGIIISLLVMLGYYLIKKYLIDKKKENKIEE